MRLFYVIFKHCAFALCPLKCILRTYCSFAPLPHLQKIVKRAKDKAQCLKKVSLWVLFIHCVELWIQTWMSFVLEVVQNIRLRRNHPGNHADHHIGKTEEYIYVDVDSNRAWLKSGWDLNVSTWIDPEHNRDHPHLEPHLHFRCCHFHYQKFQNQDLKN